MDSQHCCVQDCVNAPAWDLVARSPVSTAFPVCDFHRGELQTDCGITDAVEPVFDPEDAEVSRLIDRNRELRRAIKGVIENAVAIRGVSSRIVMAQSDRRDGRKSNAP